jgi:chromatin remodeling complex protein RSC6
VIPYVVSDAMCEFLGNDPGSHATRTQITSAISKYVKKAELQTQPNKQIIVPDEKLGVLLKNEENATVTFASIQKMLKHHFLEKV